MAEFLTLDSGEKIYVDERGTGPAIICVHGLGGASYFFANIADQLKATRRVIAIDLPGSGFSPRGKTPFTFERAAEIVLEVAAKRVGGPVTLLGHSMGAIIVLKAYAKQPAAVANLILAGGLPDVMPDAKTRLKERAATIRKNGTMIGMGETLVKSAMSPQSIEGRPVAAALLSRLFETNSAEAYVETLEALVAASAADVIPNVKVKCQLITGSEDKFAPPSAMELLMDALPVEVSYSKFPNCGHLTFLEAPEPFVSVVEQFLGGDQQ